MDFQSLLDSTFQSRICPQPDSHGALDMENNYGKTTWPDRKQSMWGR